MVNVHVELNGHVLDVVGHDGDPCCADTGPPEMMDGAAIYLDGTHYDPARHGGQPVTAALEPLTGLPDATEGRLLERHEATLGADGRLVFDDPVVFGEGQRLGRPCAAALPTP